MANIISQILTAKSTQQTGVGVLDYIKSDIFISNDNIFLFFNISQLNNLRIQTGTFPLLFSKNSYNMVIFLCDSIDENDLFLNCSVFNISASNGDVNGDYFSKELSNEFNFTNDDLIKSIIDTNDVIKINKNFKLIIRFTPENTQDNEQVLKTGDIVQDLKVFLDLSQQGPYEVGFENVDLVSPDDFTDAQRNSIYDDYLSFFGYENLRTYYPLGGISNNHPLVVFQHANGSLEENYSFYQSRLASYGYVCISIPWDSWNNSLKIGSSNSFTAAWGFFCLNVINHLKLNKLLIKNNLFNIVNFNKIILAGHSRGGGGILGAVKLLQNPTILNENISYDISLSDVKCLVFLSPSIQDVMLEDGTPLTVAVGPGEIDLSNYTKYDMNIKIPSICILPDKELDVGMTSTSLYRNLCINDEYNISNNKMHIVSKNTTHQDLGENFYRSSSYLGYSPIPSLEEWFVNNNNFHIQQFIFTEIILFLQKELYGDNTSSVFIKTSNQILKNNLKYYYKTEDYVFTDVLFYLDQFKEVSTELTNTFTTSSHHDIMMDNTFLDIYKQSFSDADEETLLNYLKLGKIFTTVVSNISPLFTDDSDPLNGIIASKDGGMSFQFDNTQTSYELSYTPIEIYNLQNASYIVVKGAQIANTTNANEYEYLNFCVTITDNQGNESTLSSKNYSRGFAPPIKYSNNNFSPVSTQNITFSIDDFVNLNPSIVLSNINNIKIRFGSDWGNSSGSFILDEIIVLK